jgi:tetratricopeptide (TPR) repeat protein
VARERFQEVWETDKRAALEHLNAALDYYNQSLQLTPSNAVTELAITHNALGVIYDHAEQLKTAIAHYEQAVQYDEQAGNHYGAANTRYNIAITYVRQGQLADALLFAQAALSGFQRYANTEQDQARVQRLIEYIEGKLGQG